MKTQQHQTDGFFYRPQTIRWILRTLYGLCAVLLIADMDIVVHRHIETSIEEYFGFYAFYGFAACVALVVIASRIRGWLMREEHYYDQNPSDTPITHQEADS